MSVAFSPGGGMIASASSDHTLRLWDVRRKKAVTTLTGHNGRAFSVTWSPDSRTIVSGSPDGTVYVWEVRILLQ
jgi:WD40 repeat protein